MRMILALALAIGLAACGQPLTEAQQADPVHQFSAEDATMNAAIEEARRGLPRFWELHAANDGSDFMVKVGFPTTSGGHEHIWVGDIQRSAAGVTAVVQNEPHDVPSIRYGERTTVDEALISDWALTRGGRTYGHYTTRVVIASLPAEEQAQYAGLLATFAEGLP